MSTPAPDGYPVWLAMMEDARERGEVRYHHPTFWRGHETPPYYEPTDVALASACACGGSLHLRCALPVLASPDSRTPDGTQDGAP